MNANQRIRFEARGRLRGNWGTALGLTGIWIAAVFVLALVAELGYYLTRLLDDNGMMDLAAAAKAGTLQLCGFFLIPAVSAVLALLLLAPLWLGLVRWFSFLAQGERLDAEAVFYYFLPANYGAAMRFSCAFFLRIAGWSAVCLLPGIIAATLPALTTENIIFIPALAANLLTAVGGLLEIGGVVLLCNRVLQCFAAPFLFVTRGGSSESIQLSIRVMNGYKMSMFGLALSFIGWALLCIFAFPAVYVFPYITEAALVSSKWMVYNYEKRQQPVSGAGYLSYSHNVPQSPEQTVSSSDISGNGRTADSSYISQ